MGQSRAIIGETVEAGMKLHGHVIIQDKKTGDVLFSKHNVITRTGKTRAAELLSGQAGTAPPNRYITDMGIGDEGAPAGSPSTPYIPLDTDPGLTHELIRTNMVNPTFPAYNQLKFTALFLTSPPLPFSGVLHAINEVALFFGDDVQPGTPRMFSRNTFPSIPFDPGDREGVIVTWLLSIV